MKGERRFSAIYRQGALAGLLNPRVAVFFLAVLPPFVVEAAGPVWAQLFPRGFLIIVAAAFIEPPLVLAGGKLTARLRDTPRIGLWMERTLGGIFAALGLRLAMAER